MEQIIIRRQEESGFKPLTDDVIAYRTISYTKHLIGLGIKPEDFDRVYELSVSVYNDTPNLGPWGVDHLIQAAKLFSKNKVKSEVYKRPERNGLVSCTTCQGSKIAFSYENGKPKSMLRNDDGSVKKCEICCED